MAASKKTPSKSTPRSSSSTPDPLDTSRAWSLDEVEPHLPPVDERRVAAVKEALVRAQTYDGLAALGADFRTEDILASVPGFAAGALFALRSLGSTPLGLATELLPLLVREARELQRVDLAYEQQLRDVGSEISGRRAQLKAANSRALRRRRGIAQNLVRHILPADAKQRAELERAAAKAPTPAATVASVRTVARIVAELRKDDALVPLLDSYRYDERCVAELEALAQETEELARAGASLTPPQSVDQRTLDRQDGIVLAIVRAIYAPLRDARDDGAAITLPPLGSIDRLVSSTGPSDEGELPPGEPTEPPAS